MRNPNQEIIRLVLSHYPDTQAIYLFGTYQTEYKRPNSDVDIALLLPPAQAKAAGLLVGSDLHYDLAALLRRDIDLINLRLVPTVLQKEVIMAERPLYQADAHAVAEFEMLTLSYYQRLNAERAEIIADAVKTGRLVA
jgi:uncharacterized protein